MAESKATVLAELRVPASDEFISVAKRVATSLGGQLGFSLDEIDELGIAVAQACGSSIEAAEELWGSGATLKLLRRGTSSGSSTGGTGKPLRTPSGSASVSSSSADTTTWSGSWLAPSPIAESR